MELHLEGIIPKDETCIEQRHAMW